MCIVISISTFQHPWPKKFATILKSRSQISNFPSASTSNPFCNIFSHSPITAIKAWKMNNITTNHKQPLFIVKHVVNLILIVPKNIIYNKKTEKQQEFMQISKCNFLSTSYMCHNEHIIYVEGVCSKCTVVKSYTENNLTWVSQVNASRSTFTSTTRVK
jgi:hypothetical protein